MLRFFCSHVFDHACVHKTLCKNVINCSPLLQEVRRITTPCEARESIYAPYLATIKTKVYSLQNYSVHANNGLHGINLQK